MTVSILLQQLLNGLTLGCIYGLIALGYTLIFGVMRLIFFAQGDLCMIGAFGAFGAISLFPNGRAFALPIALAGATAAAVAVGVLSQRVAMRPLRSAPRTKQLIASIGVSIVLQNAVLVWVSSQTLVFPTVLPGANWLIDGVTVNPSTPFIVVGAAILMTALEWTLRRTRLGLHLRAVSESPETAELDGISVDGAMTWTFIIGSILAACAGVMLCIHDGVAKYDMGFLPGIKGFTAAIVGGFGRPSGAMLGGILLGIAEGLAAGYISSIYKDLIAFVLLVLVLVARPEGLLPRVSQ